VIATPHPKGDRPRQLFKMRWKDVKSLRRSYDGYSTLQGADLIAEAWWIEMGKKWGFDGKTAGPAPGLDERYFMAVPK